MAAKSETPKVKNPHPLMQLGTPSIDVETSHISQFMVFRMNNGGGAPVHVENVSAEITDPFYIRKLVGGGRYQIRAQANGQASGKAHMSVLHMTQFEWDGAPNIKASQSTSASTEPVAPTSFVEQASQHGPAIVGAVSTAIMGFMQIFNSARESRAAEERERREYDENRRRDEKEERERRDAKDRAEAEDRRAREAATAETLRAAAAQEAEERREERRLAEDARRAADQKREDERLVMMRADQDRRAATEQMMLKTLLEGKASGGLDQAVLLKMVLERQAAPAAGPGIDQILGAAQKLKDFSEAGDKELMGQVFTALAPTPVGQEILARAASLVGMYPKPEPSNGGGQAPPAQVEQQPVEQLPPTQPEPPPVVQQSSGPVQIVN